MEQTNEIRRNSCLVSLSLHDSAKMKGHWQEGESALLWWWGWWTVSGVFSGGALAGWPKSVRFKVNRHKHFFNSRAPTSDAPSHWLRLKWWWCAYWFRLTSVTFLSHWSQLQLHSAIDWSTTCTHYFATEHHWPFYFFVQFLTLLTSTARKEAQISTQFATLLLL